MSTLFEKLWDSHVVHEGEGDQPDLLYVDLHLVHEVTSPQAFEGLRLGDRKVRRPDKTVATIDHNVPTTDRSEPVKDPLSAKQMETLENNCDEFGVELHGLGSERHGIVHVIGPEMGITRPGMTIVCGDSLTSTHGAFGALAFGIGTSEVEHVLATQCLWQKRPKSMRINYFGERPPGVTAKDMILATIGKIGTGGGVGHVIEYAGPAIENLSMEERMTICNMSIEAGARAGLIAPDTTTFEYLKGRPGLPDDFDAAVSRWRDLNSAPDASFDKEITVNVSEMGPMVTWGTTPEMVASVTGCVPDPESLGDRSAAETAARSLRYMGLKPGTPIVDIEIDRVFIGSCTNSRIEDLRAAASFIEDRKISSSVMAMVVPGSRKVKEQAEKEGLDQVFKDAGFEWRESGCSMCLAMNPDVLEDGERCASTSNRNFEGRQGKGSRTHLVSPQMAAAAAIEGHFVDIRSWGD